MVKVGINGFGRIGRNVLRAALGRDDFQVVAINDLTDSKTLAHLLKYDSLSGTLQADVKADEGQLLVDGKTVRVFSERDPAAIPWSSVGVDIALRPPVSSLRKKKRKFTSPKVVLNASSFPHRPKTMTSRL